MLKQQLNQSAKPLPMEMSIYQQREEYIWINISCQNNKHIPKSRLAQTGLILFFIRINSSSTLTCFINKHNIKSIIQRCRSTHS